MGQEPQYRNDEWLGARLACFLSQYFAFSFSLLYTISPGGSLMQLPSDVSRVVLLSTTYAEETDDLHVFFWNISSLCKDCCYPRVNFLIQCSHSVFGVLFPMKTASELLRESQYSFQERGSTLFISQDGCTRHI